jgi:hypothetical protein
MFNASRMELRADLTLSSATVSPESLVYGVLDCWSRLEKIDPYRKALYLLLKNRQCSSPGSFSSTWVVFQLNLTL